MSFCCPNVLPLSTCMRDLFVFGFFFIVVIVVVCWWCFYYDRRKYESSNSIIIADSVCVWRGYKRLIWFYFSFFFFNHSIHIYTIFVGQYNIRGHTEFLFWSENAHRTRYQTKKTRRHNNQREMYLKKINKMKQVLWPKTNPFVSGMNHIKIQAHQSRWNVSMHTFRF